MYTKMASSPETHRNICTPLMLILKVTGTLFSNFESTGVYQPHKNGNELSNQLSNIPSHRKQTFESLFLSDVDEGVTAETGLFFCFCYVIYN